MGALRGSERAWGPVMRSLHWGMAALILVQFALGWLARGWSLSPTKLELFVWHKSLGVVALALVVLRLLWRLWDRAPTPPPGTRALEHRAAVGVHALLYLAMLATPLSGWAIQSASGFPFEVFGWFALPDPIGRDKALQGLAETVHLALFWLFLALLLPHVAAAVHHHWWRRDPVLRRMLTGRPGREVA